MSILDSARRAVEKEKGSTKRTNTFRNTINKVKISSNSDTTTKTEKTKSILDSARKAVAKEREAAYKRTTQTTGSPTEKRKTDFATDTNNAYTKAKNAKNNTVNTSNGMTEEERKSRIAEIDKEISRLQLTINGKNRGHLSTDEETNKISKLRKEKTALERTGTFTETELLQFDIADAKKRVTEYRNLLSKRPSQSEVGKYQEAGKEYAKALSDVNQLERKQGLYDNIEKYSDVVNKDTFAGQTKSNFRYADLSREADYAMDNFISNPTKENRDIAYAYDALAKLYAENNKEALDDENVKLSWISKSLASYLPQGIDQIVPQVAGGIAGGTVGYFLGHPMAGASAGAGLATGIQSYSVMRGSVYRTLIAEGVDEETALEAAKDEALINGLIEGGETAASIAMLGIGKGLTAIGNAAKGAVAKGSTNVATKLLAKMASKGTKNVAKEAAKPLWQKGLILGAGLGLQGASEGNEEWLQQGVSIANQRRALDRNEGGSLIGDSAKVWLNAITGKDEEALSQMNEAWGEGFKVGLMLEGSMTVTNNVISQVANAKTVKQQNEIFDFVINDEETLTGLIEEGKALGEESTKIAEEIENARKSGKVTRNQVKRLIDSNEVYIKSTEDTDEVLKDTSSINLEKNIEDYPYDIQKTIEGYADNVDSNILSFINRVHSLKNESYKKRQKVEIAPISKRFSKDVKELTGIDITEYKNVLTGNGLEHIERDHGTNGSSDQSMANVEDIARIGFVVKNYDTIKISTDKDWQYRNSDGTSAQKIILSKKINGTFYVVEAVPDSNAKAIVVKTAYIKKNNNNHVEGALILNANAPRQQTSETLNHANIITAVDDSVLHSNGVVNGKDSASGIEIAQARANKAAYEAGLEGVPMDRAGLETDAQIEAYNLGRMEAIKNMPKDKVLKSNDSNGRIEEADTKGVEENGIDRSSNHNENDNGFSQMQSTGKAGAMDNQLPEDNVGKRRRTSIITRNGGNLETRTLESLVEDKKFGNLSNYVGNEISYKTYNSLLKKFKTDTRLTIEGYDFSDVVTYDMLTNPDNELREIFADNIAEYFGKQDVNRDTKGVEENGIDRSSKNNENDNRHSQMQGRTEENSIYSGLSEMASSGSRNTKTDKRNGANLETRAIEVLIEDKKFSNLSNYVGNEISKNLYKILYNTFSKDTLINEGYDFSDVVTYDMLTNPDNELREIFADNIAEYFGKQDVNRDIAGNPVDKSISEKLKDSVVKNEQGQLIPVYHSTNEVFKEFKPSDIGIHFGSLSQAKQRATDKGNKRARIIKAYLNITNPLIIEKDFTNWNAAQLAEELIKADIISFEQAEAYIKQGNINAKESNAELVEILKSKGYDGIIYNNEYEALNGRAYIAFDNSRIIQINEKATEKTFDGKDSRADNFKTDNEILDAHDKEVSIDVVRKAQANSADINEIKTLKGIAPKFIQGLKNLAKGIGVEIRIYDGEKLRIEGVDGFYDSTNRIIYLDYNNPVKPIEAVVRHEVVHVFAKDNPSGYQKFADFVVEKYIEQNSEEDYNTWTENKKKEIDTINKARAEAEYGRQLTDEEFASLGRSCTNEKAIEELCADIGMDMMQSEATAKEFISQNRRAAEKLKDIIRKIRNIVRKAFNLPQNFTIADAMIQLSKFDSTVSTIDGKVERNHAPYKNNNLPGTLKVSDLKEAERLLMKGLLDIDKARDKARIAVWNEHGKELKALEPKERVKRARELIEERIGEGDTEKDNSFSIVFLDNGNTYVRASRNVITGNDKAVWRKQVTKLFKDLLAGGKSIDITTLEGDILTITKKETANKARDDYKYINGKRVKMSDDEFQVKLKAEAHIDEIAETSMKPNANNVIDTKSHTFAKSGFSYRTAYFEDFDGKYYKLKISVGHNGNIATIYNVGEINKDSLPSATKIVAVTGSKPLGMLSVDNNVSQDEPIVNNNILKNLEDDTPKVDFSATIIRNKNVEQTNKWHPDLSAPKLKILMQIIQKDIDASTQSVTDKANWLFTRINNTRGTGSTDVFAIYSTENPDSPTLLYESKDKKAVFERDYLLDYMEAKENGKSNDRKSNIVGRVSDGDWVQRFGNLDNIDRPLARESSNRDAAVLQGQSKGNTSPAFRSVIRNLFEVREGREGRKDVSFSATIPKGENPSRDIDVPAEDKNGRKVSRGVRTVLEAKATPDSYISPIMADIEEGKYSYDVITDEFAQESAFNRISNEDKETGERILDTEKYKRVLNDTLDRFENGDLDGKNDVALLQALYTNAANSYDYLNQVDENGVPLAEKLIVAMVQTASKAGQTLQASRLLKKTTPAGKLYDLEMFVKNMNKEIKAQWGEWVENENAEIEKQWGKYEDGKRNYKTDREAKKRRKESRRRGRAYSKKQKDIVLNNDLAEQLLSANSQQEANAIEEEITKDIAEQIKSTAGDKLRSLRYTSMLLNSRTHIRNIVGNTIFAGIVKVRNTMDASLQSIIIKDKSQRTKAFALTKNQRAEQNKLIVYANDVFNEQTQFIRGESGKYDTFNNAIDENRKIFGFSPLEGARRINFNLLESEDVFFIRRHFNSTFANELLAKGITISDIENGKVSRKIIESAMRNAAEQAQKATFRDANSFAKAINNLEKTNLATDLAVSGTLPFKKTPINILKRGIEYSPLSLVKAVSKTITQNTDVKKGHLDSVDVVGIIENLSEGLTGTALFALGAWLVRAGILAIRPGDDDEDEALGEAMGHQSYALEIEGYSFTIDWAAPAIMPLFTGAELTKSLEEGFGVNTLELLARMSDPVIETSMLSGVLGVLDSIRYSESGSDVAVDLVTEVLSSYLMQYVPSLFGAIARTFDEVESRTSRPSKTGDEGFLEMLGRKIANKTPILRNIADSKPYVDIMGKYKEKQGAGDYLLSALQNFLLPGYVSKITSSDATKELSDVMLTSKRTDFIPKYVTKVNDRRLTHNEYFNYHEKRGELYDEVMSYLTSQSWYKNCSEDQKAEILKEFKETADKLTKKRLFPSEYNLNNKSLESIYKKGCQAEDIVDSYLCDKYISFTADADNDGKIQKAELVDAISDMEISNDDAWDLYLNKYSGKSAVEAEKHGIDAKLYMTATIVMNGIKADYKPNGKAINGSRRKKIEKYLNSVCSSYREYLFLLGTEYPSVKDDYDYIKFFGK